MDKLFRINAYTLWMSIIIIAMLSVITIGHAKNYAVTHVKNWDTLNLRSQASANSKVITKIPYNASNITLTGRSKKKGSSTWVEILWKGKKGWVSQYYIKPSLNVTASPQTSTAVTRPSSVAAVIRPTVSRNNVAPHYYVAGVKNWDTLNMRKKASSNSKILAKLPYNAKNIVLMGSNKGGWVKIKWQGKVGWVSRRYIKRSAMQRATTKDVTDSSSIVTVNTVIQNRRGGVDRSRGEIAALARKLLLLDANKPEKVIPSTEKIVGRVRNEPINKKVSRGSWVLQCGSVRSSWLVNVFPKYLELATKKDNIVIPIIAKHQEKNTRNVALKTYVKGRNKTVGVNLDITYTRNCLDTSTHTKVPYTVKATINGKTRWGCCKAIRID